MGDTLRTLQLTQLEILKIIDDICNKNNLRYSLYAGTLLGAARHKGFIPWDDDLDVCMPREDYDKFIKIWPTVKPEGYILQNKDNTPRFSQSFTKIRKEHTTFMQMDSERNAYHTGIFVDIFPMDRIPNGKIKQLIFKWNCIKYQLLTREFVPPKSNVVVKCMAKILLISIPKAKRKQAREKLLRKITIYNNNQSLQAVTTEVIETLKLIYPPDIWETLVKLKFEDGEFSCFAKWDESLQLMYGDYMQLPPEDEREWKHHPIILDFEHDYEEINPRGFC